MGRCAVLIAFYEDNSSLWCLFEQRAASQEQNQSGTRRYSPLRRIDDDIVVLHSVSKCSSIIIVRKIYITDGRDWPSKLARRPTCSRQQYRRLQLLSAYSVLSFFQIVSLSVNVYICFSMNLFLWKLFETPTTARPRPIQAIERVHSIALQSSIPQTTTTSNSIRPY
jgi:hypothetical protein